MSRWVVGGTCMGVTGALREEEYSLQKIGKVCVETFCWQSRDTERLEAA